MKKKNRMWSWAGRAASPEAWALGALILFAIALQARTPEGPMMQLTYASCAGPAEYVPGAPLEARLGEMAERIDSRTERVWRRLEWKMRMLEERLAKTPGACEPARGIRASMFEE
jgi:hypothetical protein